MREAQRKKAAEQKAAAESNASSPSGEPKSPTAGSGLKCTYPTFVIYFNN
jgi:hypothetical protein